MKKLLTYNDDGWSSLMRYPAPCSADEIAAHTVGLVAGTGVDIYQMCLLTGNVAIHRSKILERYGQHLGNPYRMHMWRVIENVKFLDAQGTDLLEIVVSKCHEVGMEAHASLRINDKHHTYKMTAGLPGMPERFLKSEYVFPDLRSSWIDSRQHMYLDDGSLNLSFEEVRKLRLDTIEETLVNYDVDGIDLDFTRFPPFFKDSEKEKNAALLSDLVRKARLLVDGKSRKTGRKIKLTARVEYHPEVNMAEGLDVENWVKSGYLDILYLGVIADCTPDAPIEPFIKLCEGSDCKMCPSIEGQFQWVGGMNRIGPVGTATPEILRAFAANSYAAGADGIQLFNFCCADGPWDRKVLSEIPYPEQLKFKNKLYYFTMAPWREFSLTCRWNSRIMLWNGENEVTYPFLIADDADEARRLYQHPSARMMMRILGLNKRDDISASLNGISLTAEKETGNYWDWDTWSDILYFNIPGNSIKKGRNILKITRSKNNEGYIGEIEVIELTLAVNYLQRNVVGSL